MALPKAIAPLGVCDFVAESYKGNPKDLIMYLCVACEITVEATTSDSHALAHRAAMIRVFNSPGAYQDWLHEEKIRATVKATA